MTDTIDRTTHIGGSDVAAILGLSKWGSPWSCWAEKVGAYQPEMSDPERLALGQDAESYLATVFERHHPGLYIRGRQNVLTNPDYPWLRGHADGGVCEAPYSDADWLAGWEAKTDNDWAPWDEVPAYYQCQAQTYMILTGLPEWRFTVGFARWQVHHYTLAADPADQQLIIDRTRRFWEDHVLTGTPPPADAHPATGVAIDAAHNADPTLTVDAPDHVRDIVAHLRTWKAQRKQADDMVAELEHTVKVFMGDATSIVRDGVPLVTWSEQTADRLDTTALRAAHPELAAEFTKTSTSRVLRVKPAKT